MNKGFFGLFFAFGFYFASLHAGFGIWLGPFELQLWGGSSSGRYIVVPQNDPICHAIRDHKLVEMLVEWEESTVDKEQKVTTKKITMEPYLFGRSVDGQLVLRGNVIYAQLIKEVTIKYGPEQQGGSAGVLEDVSPEEKPEVPIKSEEPSEQKEGVFTGYFRSSTKEKDRIATVNIQKVSEIHVLEESIFTPPADWVDIFKGNLAEVFCAINRE